RLRAAFRRGDRAAGPLHRPAGQARRRAPVRRSGAVADTPTADASGAVSAAGGEPLLRIRGLRKQYGPKVVLDRIDLDVAAHQVVCLIGASGSGKSTLLRCIDLLEELDDGTIHLGEVELSDPALDADAARRRIGVVFQAYNLFPHLTVLDNITLAPRRVHRKARRDA